VSRFAPKNSPLVALLVSVATLFLCSLPLRATREKSRPSGKGAVTAREPRASRSFDFRYVGWGLGDAVWACNAKHGNCTDFHSLFIGMARAAGIPARFEIGFPLPLNAHDGTIPGYHCWAEFFVSGLGWIPIDASETWQDPSKKNYFFGATDENRVMFSLGRDIRLNPPPAATPLNFFVYPYAEVDGKPFAALKHEFSFRDDAAVPTTTAQNR